MLNKNQKNKIGKNKSIDSTAKQERAKKKPGAAKAAAPTGDNVKMIHKKLEEYGAKTDDQKLAFLKTNFKFTASDINTLSIKQVGLILARLIEYSKTVS